VTNRDILIYAAMGLGVWLNGVVTFRLGGRLLFEHGPLVTAAAALVIAFLVCAVFRATMTWRKGAGADAVAIAVIMALPGLFGETARQLVFSWATGLRPDEAASFAAVIFFGNAALMTYAVMVWRRATKARLH
jgi:hypothetical protein